MKKPISKITDVLTLLVFAVFSLCVLLVMLFGAGVYRNLTEAGTARFDRRTAARYITTRVRQAQTLAVEQFEGIPALVMREKTEEEDCLIRIYGYEGTLRELYCEASARLRPKDGEAVLPVESLDFSLQGAVLTVKLGSDRLILHIPQGTEAGP